MKTTSTQFVCGVSFALILSVVGVAGQGPVMVGGRNVNINGGPSALSISPPLFAGDFNKKMQNEGHCSSNPSFPAHLICAFNEYKGVLDIPGLDALTPLTRDAFMGIAQSNDFGNHWVSDLLPGSLLDSRTQPDGTPWPLKVEGFRAAADAVTATTPGGLAHVSGIFFKSLTGKGAVAVSTFIDPGNDEASPAPFQLVRQSILDIGAPVPGTSRFYDKPWMEIGLTAVGTCTVSFRAADGATRQKTVPAHPIYVVAAAFTGVDPDDANTEQYFYRSLDCGATWSKSIKISSSAINQSMALAVQPGTGHIYGVYRRFVDVNTTDAMMWVRSTDGGATFSPPQVLVEICPFTQGTSERRFRINSFPTMTAGPNGVYAAWSAKRRDPSGVCDTEGPALIQTSSFSATSGWSSPAVVEDPAAVGATLSGNHQIFPSISFNSNHVGLIWYDFRNDMASLGGSREAARSPSGIVEPVASPGTPATRHTVDVRGVMADLSQGLNPNGSPKFGPSTEISRYLTGVRAADPTAVVQLQYNRPNLRMFRLAPTSVPRGVPFFSDYISLTPIRGATGSSGPLFYAVWTDTRDALSVNLPTGWTAPNWSVFGSNSLVDSTQTRPVCTTNPLAGVLDMNLYGAVISKGGLFAYSPNSSKPLGATARTFLVIVRNSATSGPPKRVRLSIRANPTGGSAVFIPEQAAAVEADIPNISSITRTVEVTEDNKPNTTLAANAPITVDITEIGGTGQVLSIVLNGDPDALPPLNVGDESYTPDIPDQLNVSSPEIDSPEIDSPEIDSPEIDSNALSPEIDSPEIDSPEIDSPEIDSPEIDSSAITDVTYTYHNNGTAATSFRTRYVGDLDPSLYSIQLLIRDQYTTQASDCVPNQFRTNQVAVNINVADVTSASVAADSIQNASAFLRPGGTAIVTARIRSRAGAPPLTAAQARETFGLVVKADGKTRPTAALDHAKPRFTKRSDIVVPSTSKDGAIVTFTPPSVLDRVDAVLGIPVTSSCASATGLTSGSLFPIGTTTINCTATDSHGNTATTDFTITVTKSKK